MAKPKQIISLEDVKPRRGILVHGNSGAGKSAFLSSGERSLVLSLDNTLDTALLMGRSCDVWPVKAWQDARECYLYLVKGGHNDYDILGVDNISVGQRLHMDEVLEEEKKKNDKRDADIPMRNDYLKNQRAFLRFVQSVNALDMRVYWSSWSMVSGREGDAQLIPALHGGKGDMSNSVSAEMRAVGYMTVNNETGGRGILWKPTAGWFARDGFHAFGEAVTDPTIPKLEQLITKKGKA